MPNTINTTFTKLPPPPPPSVHASAAEKVNTRGFKDLLNDHSSVLPDYGRIPPLSDALGDLYKEFNALKERLGELTTKFEGVESSVDDMRAGRSPSQSRAPTGTGTRPQGRRNRVVVRRVKIPANGLSGWTVSTTVHTI
uniref:Uncharacterized protein n=1 Tax=Oncorhynchus mykiss TaxID=8022 RepID=A0A8L0DQ99_ONCMY